MMCLTWVCRLDTAAAQLEPELFRKTELNVKEDLTQLETKQVILKHCAGQTPLFLGCRKLEYRLLHCICLSTAAEPFLFAVLLGLVRCLSAALSILSS